MQESATKTTSGHDVPALGSQLCFALYSASRSMTAAYRPFLDDMGITFPQFLVLLVLWERPGVTMKELGEQLRLDYGTVSPIVARLRGHGLVDSVRNAQDGRAVALWATRATVPLQQRAGDMIQAVTDGVQYPGEQLTALRDQVNTLATRLDAYTTR